MPKLFVVATPIGNLDDITIRAIETLKNVDLVLSEDTRETDKLFQKYNFKKSQISYRDQNHADVVTKIITMLDEGKDLALVSDSGTPAISDPGYKLVNSLVSKGYSVEAIPGPSAIISSLSISGLPTDRFLFLGFLPKKENQRLELLKKYSDCEATIVIYESPYRVKKLLTEITNILGNRTVCLAKDLTKLHESVITAKIEDLLNTKLVEKGEYAVLIAKEGFSL